MQDEATEIILTLNNNKLHPLVLSYSKLTEIIITNAKGFNTELINHEAVTQIIKVEHTEIKGQIMVKIEIPIIESKTYRLYKPYILPMNNTNTYVINRDYIAASTENHEVIEIKQEEIQNCKKISNINSKDTLICKKNQLKLTNSETDCLTTLFINPLNADRDCKIYQIQPTNTITYMVNPNTWLYSIYKQVNAKVECKEQVKMIKLIGNGKLSFNETCRITTKEFTITTNGEEKTINIEQPKIIQSEETALTQEIQNHQDNNYNPITKLTNHAKHNNEFTKEVMKIKNLQNMNEQISLSRHVFPQSTKEAILPITTLTIAAITILVIAYVCHKKSRKNKHESINIQMVNQDTTTEQNTTPKVTRATKKVETPIRMI